MYILLLIILILMGWFIIGCIVLAAIDDEHQSLLKWASSCPIIFGYEITVMCWPIIVWYWWKRRD